MKSAPPPSSLPNFTSQLDHPACLPAAADAAYGGKLLLNRGALPSFPTRTKLSFWLIRTTQNSLFTFLSDLFFLLHVRPLGLLSDVWPQPRTRTHTHWEFEHALVKPLAPDSTLSSPMSDPRVIVVGGGLSGLSALHTLYQRGANVLILDKQGL